MSVFDAVPCEGLKITAFQTGFLAHRDYELCKHLEKKNTNIISGEREGTVTTLHLQHAEVHAERSTLVHSPQTDKHTLDLIVPSHAHG